MEPVIILFLAAWLICGMAAEVEIMERFCNEEFISPAILYSYTKMNIFGCWICFILISILNPLGTIFKLICVIMYNIIKFVKYIFTVGRED